MKSLMEFLKENKEVCPECGNEPCTCGNEEETCRNEEEEMEKAKETIKDEKDFRSYAENKFKEVFGDDLDKERMDFTIDGLLKDNKDLVDKGEWGELVGKLNKSFGHN